MFNQLKIEIEEIADQLVDWRRGFHRNPEIAFEEHRTSSVIRDFLEQEGILATPCAQTGLIGVLEGESGGPTVALRADMDALPLKEEGSKEYISQNPKAAHACGHDGHMAILMGTAKLLARRKKQLKGKEVFLFQPSEERIPGGATKMIEEGALEGVDAIFGLHLWQSMPSGSVGIVKGVMMAQPDTFSIVVKGRGGHGSMPHQTVDTILVASHLVVNIQSIVSRNMDPLRPAVVSFGSVKGGTIYNIIPSEVTLTGTVRSLDPSVQALVERRMREMTEGTCRTFGARAKFEYEKGFPPVVNDDALADFVKEVAGEVLGRERLRAIEPVMGGEDFSYFLQKVPGAYFFFGMGDGTEFPHHHPAFDIDERALPQATLLMTSLALDYLRRNKSCSC